MNKKLTVIWGLVALAAVILLLVFYKFNHSGESYSEIDKRVALHDATYTVGGQKVTLINGVSETEAAPGSASKIVTRYFGNEVKADFNKDGREDSAFILTQETGGSGTFYYVVALLNKSSGRVGSEAVLLGDRISPQSTNLEKNNIVVVNYADRKAGESFDVQPSFGKSIRLLLDTKTMQFGEVAKNFEGEANPAQMTLTMKTWVWVKTTYSDGKEITPRLSNKFTLTFKSNNVFSASTDCNGIGGEYAVKKGNQIIFDRMMSTLMYCEDSQENDFRNMLKDTESYLFTSKGELVLSIKSASGSVIFK